MKDMTNGQLVEKAKAHDRGMNEGGEGYNPYRDELERREIEDNQKRAAQPKTKKEQIALLHDKIRVECGSVSREWGNEEADKKQAGYYSQIKKLEEELEKEFKTEWTVEETQSRRESWNGFVRSLMDDKGRINVKDQPKMYQRAIDQGWNVEDLKKAVALHKLGVAK